MRLKGPNSLFSFFISCSMFGFDSILMYSCVFVWLFFYLCPPKENKNDIWDFFSLVAWQFKCIPTVVKQILSWYEKTVTTHILYGPQFDDDTFTFRTFIYFPDSLHFWCQWNCIIYRNGACTVQPPIFPLRDINKHLQVSRGRHVWKFF